MCFPSSLRCPFSSLLIRATCWKAERSENGQDCVAFAVCVRANCTNTCMEMWRVCMCFVCVCTCNSTLSTFLVRSDCLYFHLSSVLLLCHSCLSFTFISHPLNTLLFYHLSASPWWLWLLLHSHSSCTPGVLGNHLSSSFAEMGYALWVYGCACVLSFQY